MKTNKSLPSISGNGSLVRPQYFPGLLLEDEDLTSAVTYTQSIVRLALRSLFGCGVVCGLGVTAAFECERRKVKVTVQKGVALDCLGNLIEIPSAVDLVYDPECEPMPSDLWVVVCYKETCCSPTTVSCSEDDPSTVVKRRVRQGYEIVLHTTQPDACSCAKRQPTPTKPDPDSCCREHLKAQSGETPAFTTNSANRSKRSQTLEDHCECYAKHNALVCDCDCDCSCVLLGHFTITPNDEQPRPVPEDVRVVRPMLLGAKACYCAECIQQAEGERATRAEDSEIDTRPVAKLSRNVMEREVALREAQFARQRGELVLLQKEALVAAAKERVKRATAAKDANEKAAAEKALAAAQHDYEEQAKIVEAAKSTEAEARSARDAAQKLLERGVIEQDMRAQQAQLAFIDKEILAAPPSLNVEPLRKKREQVAELVRSAQEKFLKL